MSTATWQFNFDTLTVLNADEDDFFSDGDEPYLAFLGVRSRFNTPGSTQVFWSGFLDDKWASAVEGGGTRAIPAQMGQVTFGGVERLALSQLNAGQPVEILGIVGIAFESDLTPFGTIKDLLNQVCDGIKAKVKSLVEDGNLNLKNPGPQIQQAIADAKASFQPTLAEKLGILFASAGDPDELVGLDSRLFLGVHPILQSSFSVPLLDQAALVLDFKAPGIHYQVSGTLAPAAVGQPIEAAPPLVTPSPFTPQAWSEWEELGGEFQGAPTAASWSANRLDVFVRGTNKHLMHRWWDGAAWSGWQDLGGGLSESPGAVSWGPNRIDCFGRGENNELWHKWWDGEAWSGWELLGGEFQGAPTVASWGENRLDVFVRGTDQHLWHRWWDGTSWSGWEDLGGGLTDSPGAVSWGPDRIDCFGRGENGELWHKWF
ncbi:MAG TPA: hypothetical protein VGS57_10910 [Thermoanaerobaculia bacterium]|jgi:hypothetical protein|nr:hypothetical protein [Thermoanaerobaculia bacterium]